LLARLLDYIEIARDLREVDLHAPDDFYTCCERPSGKERANQASVSSRIKLIELPAEARCAEGVDVGMRNGPSAQLDLRAVQSESQHAPGIFRSEGIGCPVIVGVLS